LARLGDRGKDRRALAAKDRGSRLVVGDGVQTREAGLRCAREHDGADGKLHGVQLSLDVARAPAPKEDQKRAHTFDASSLPRSARSSSLTSKRSTRALRTAPAMTRSSAMGTWRRTASHCGSLQSKIFEGSSLTLTGKVSQ